MMTAAARNNVDATKVVIQMAKQRTKYFPSKLSEVLGQNKTPQSQDKKPTITTTRRHNLGTCYKRAARWEEIEADEELLAYLRMKVIGEQRDQEQLRRLRQEGIAWLQSERKEWSPQLQYIVLVKSLTAVMEPHENELRMRQALKNPVSRENRMKMNELSTGYLGRLGLFWKQKVRFNESREK